MLQDVRVLGGRSPQAQRLQEKFLIALVETGCGDALRPGDETAYARAAGGDVARITFLQQPEPLGYGDAILRARQFVGDEPFLHLVGDHLYVSDSDRRCAEQLIEVATQHECAVSAVQATVFSMSAQP